MAATIIVKTSVFTGTALLTTLIILLLHIWFNRKWGFRFPNIYSTDPLAESYVREIYARCDVTVNVTREAIGV